MSNTMEYRGYTGSVEYSAEDRVLHGRLVGIRDRVIFDGVDVKTLEKNFHGAVDEYLAFCKEEGRTPDKPFKGSLNIRIPSELHRTLAIRAEQQHKSLNSVIAEQLASAMGILPGIRTALLASIDLANDLANRKSESMKPPSVAGGGKAAVKPGRAHRKVS
jgi:predicted HicB family RNase H-like nuclease